MKALVWNLFIFLGQSPKNKYLFSFKIVYLPSLLHWITQFKNTSSPNKIFDSFAAKTPIVQNTTRWIMDLVLNENCGLNSQPGDPVAFGNSIFTICDNSEIRDKLSYGAFKVANELFNRDLLAYRFLEGIIKSKS
jgi:glycosyltransferase involved in cell wall biosynthesis